jgi:hypothetical protein
VGRGSEEAEIAGLLSVNLGSYQAPRGAARRAQHGKTTGCLRATFIVRGDVPEDLRAGLFAAPAAFDAIIRFSNGRTQDDRKADAHGMAIKILGVPGPKLAQRREGESAQDFVLVDSETFFTGDPEEYRLVNDGLVGTTSWWGRLSFWLRLLLGHRALLGRILGFVSHRPHSPLGEWYFSTTPYRCGGATVKWVARPRGLADAGDPHGPNGLAERLAAQVARETLAFDLGADVQVDAVRQPVEDPKQAWSAHPKARRVWLASLVIPHQNAAELAEIAERLAFSPWHALPAHEPLGFINRARAPIYAALGERRQVANGVAPPGTSEAA